MNSPLPTITPEEWAQIQTVELATWTPAGWTDPATGKTYTPYPSFDGKLERERHYQRETIVRFGIDYFMGLVLDIGCGPSPILEQVVGDFTGFGVDPLIQEYAKYHDVRAWRKTIPMTCPAEAIPLLDESAAFIISTNALDHFRDPGEAVEEMVRLLAPGGTLYLQFCIENATRGHPHPAHKLDLTDEMVLDQIGGRLRLLKSEFVEYAWRKQPAWMGIFDKEVDNGGGA